MMVEYRRHSSYYIVLQNCQHGEHRRGEKGIESCRMIFEFVNGGCRNNSRTQLWPTQAYWQFRVLRLLMIMLYGRKPPHRSCTTFLGVPADRQFVSSRWRLRRGAYVFFHRLNPVVVKCFRWSFSNSVVLLTTAREPGRSDWSTTRGSIFSSLQQGRRISAVVIVFQKLHHG